MKHKLVCVSPGLYESTYRCERCGKQACVSIEDTVNHFEIERCPVGERATKIIRKLVDGQQSEAVIRRQYKMTKDKLERFKKHHARAIHLQETKKFGKIFNEEL